MRMISEGHHPEKRIAEVVHMKSKRKRTGKKQTLPVRKGTFLRKTLIFGVVLVALFGASFCRVRGSQEFYLTVGDTMVIPSLAELWSDQEYSCTVGNPDVLMLDGSGRAVTALRSGVSDLYVHVTNPDMDLYYCFVVAEPAPVCEETPDRGWTTPGPQGSPEGTGNQSLTREDHKDRENEGEGAAATGQASGERGTGLTDTAQGSAENGARPTDAGKSSAENRADPADMGQPSAEGGVSPADAEQSSAVNVEGILDAEEPAGQFWENPAEGGIVFERIRTDAVRIISDGEVRPVFVSVGGREVRWKYESGVLYLKNIDPGAETVRGGALDTWGNMYYFSFK